MKKNYFTVCCLLISYFSYSQRDTKKYQELWNKGDSLYEVKDYKNAAITYSSALVLSAASISSQERLITARSWSMANYPDSAFLHLNTIASSKDLTFYFIKDMITENDFIPLHNDKRWKDVNDKLLSNVEGTILSKESLYRGKLNSYERYDVACAWALMNKPDSAFAQLNIIAKTKVNTYIDNGHPPTYSDLSSEIYSTISTEASLNALHQDKRWQPAVEAIYKNIASTLSAAISEESLKPNFNGRYFYENRYDIACAWALLNSPDSAFFQLNIIGNDTWNTLYKRIVNEHFFNSLHTDSRWLPLLDRLKKNYFALKGRHNYRGAFIPMVFTIDPSSSYLRSDGLGSYRHGVNSVESGEGTAFHFFIRNQQKIESSPRTMILDLSNPVPGSGAISHGIIRENQEAEFHVFYKWDRTITPWIVYNLRDIPVDSTIESPRSEVRIRINGIMHLLQLGPYCQGDGNEPYAYGGHISGEGTTKVLVTRNTKTSYTIIAPAESIGRLWNVSNWSNPIDKGLFKTGFIIHLEYQ